MNNLYRVSLPKCSDKFFNLSSLIVYISYTKYLSIYPYLFLVIKMGQFKVRLQGDDEKEYVINYEGLRQALGFYQLTSDIKDIRDTVRNLRDLCIERLLVPEMEELILKVVEENPDIETRKLNEKRPYDSWNQLAWYRAFDSLKEQKRILGTSQGRGKNRTWKISSQRSLEVSK